MPNTYLYRTNSQSYNRKTWTFSAWIKRSMIDSANKHLYATDTAANNFSRIYINGSNHLVYYDANGGSTACYLETNRVLRDDNAWYHVMIVLDTTQSTADNRIKMYINGVQETSFAYRTNPSQDADLRMNINTQHNLGKNGQNQTAEYWDGYMSHVHFIDGTAYDASAFGSTDSTTGEWQINASPNVTYGTNGWFILKDGNSGTDQSPNSNNYTASGNLTKSEDNPSNVFATLNANDNYYASSSFSHGNLSITTNSTKYAPTYSTLGASSGKYYAECKMTAGSSARIGIISRPPEDTGATSSPGNDVYSVGYYSVHGTSYYDNSASTYGSSYTNGDIIGIAMDLDNNKLYFHKNGTYQNSGVPTSGSTGTGALTIPTPYNGNFFHFAVSDQHDSQDASFSWNFGNGYFGTTAVSSAGTNASGLGIFEYDVPAGYTALCTKGLNE